MTHLRRYSGETQKRRVADKGIIYWHAVGKFTWFLFCFLIDFRKLFPLQRKSDNSNVIATGNVSATINVAYATGQATN